MEASLAYLKISKSLMMPTLKNSQKKSATNTVSTNRDKKKSREQYAKSKKNGC